MIQQIAFIIILGTAIYFIRKRILFIRRTVNLGKDKSLNDRPGERLKKMLLVAFGQRKMFKRPLPAILHFFIYAGFLIINLEVLEFVIDGLAGTHRIFAPFLGGFYNVLMNFFEFLAVAVLLSCVIMLMRRNVLKIKRFWSSEMTSWPRLDANIILITEIVLMVAILTMNASDQLLQARSVEHYSPTGPLLFSGVFTPALQHAGTSTLILLERIAWWFHIVGILGFAVYITFSKHLHIFLAFPNTYFANLEPKGHMENMPVVTNEVKMMLGLGDATRIASCNAGKIWRKGYQ